MMRGPSRSSALAAVALLVLLLSACSAVGPALPTANAGSDQQVVVGATVVLDGSASSDPLGRSLGFAWSFAAKPSASAATIDSANQPLASFVADRAGSYVVELTVSNGDQQATDTTTITAVSAATGRLEPGETVIHASGTLVAAQPNTFTGSIDIFIEEVDDPSLVIPLPSGVTIVGQAHAISSTPAVAADPDHPFVVGLSVPAGLDTAGLALALLERNGVYGSLTPPEEDHGESLSPSWIVLEGAYEPVVGVLLAPLLAFGEEPLEVVLVRAEGFDTRMIGEAASGVVESTSTLAFEGVCGPGFADAVETCTAADRSVAADMLEQSYFGLTDFGFTATPRLMRAASSWDVSFDPFRIRLVPGPYLIELRPSSSAIAGGMFSSSTGRMWIAIGTAGMDESRRRIVRHEYVHATQYGYGVTFSSTAQWLRSRWVEEGQAVLLESSFSELRRGNRPVRSLDDSLQRSRWDGSDWLEAPSSEYQAQDFWWYLAARFGHADASFLRPFVERGMQAADIDAVLRSAYPPAFGGSGSSGGLARAYWDWAKNHVFTKEVDVGPAFGQTCAFTLGSATPTRISYAEGQAPATQTRTLEPLTAHVYRVDFAQPVHASYLASMIVSSPGSATRSVFYRADAAGTDACFGQADSSSATVNVGSTLRYFVVVGNTSLTQSVEHTLQFPSLTIMSPAGGSVVEGSIGFSAAAAGFASTPSISWSRQRVSGGTPFFFGPTSSGETIDRTVCDGEYFVRAEAGPGGGSALVSQTLRLEVNDLGATQLVPGCEPSVSITQPVPGGAYATGAPITLRADASVRGEATYPIQWRRGSADGQVVASGEEVELAFFNAGEVLLFATFGAASDSVRFIVADGTPPTASVDDPADGSVFAWFDHLENQSGIEVTFAGSGLSGTGASLAGSALRWESRRTDLSTWADHGTGATKTIFFGYGGAAVSQAYEVRLVATDPSNGLIATDSITIVIQRPPD